MTKAFAVGFDDLTQEQLEPVPLRIEGEIPRWLAGAFLRNGPAWFTIDGQRYQHWFDGLAMLHRFGFHQGTVIYNSRFLQSRNYMRTRESGQPEYDQFASNPRRSIWAKIVDSLYFPLQFGNNDLVSFGRLDDCWVALGETPIPLTFDPVTLESPDGPWKFKDWVIGMITSAHPVRDERRRTLYNYDTFVFPGLSKYVVWRLDDGTRNRQKLVSLRASRPSYMHSFGASENYLIVTELPLRLRPLSMLMGAFTGTPFIENFDWTGEDVIFTVIEKDSGSVTGTFRAPAFFAFHHVNAWEDGSGVINVDIARYDDASVIEQTYFSQLLGEDGGHLPVSQLVRFRVPTVGSGALMPPEVLSATAFEMPAIHPGLVGHRYRFTYGYGFDESGNLNDTLYKVDLDATPERRLTRWSEAECYPSEPVFVPRPGAVDEDDGVVLSVLLDARAKASYLLVLDARSFTELGRAWLPRAIPFGLHGTYAPAGSGT